MLSQALMEAEVAASIGAERHERTGERTAYRNGSRTRTWDTRVGTIELAIPKVTPGSYFPSLRQPRRRAEHALLAVVQEAYVHGVSTRKVDELMKALSLDGVSKSEVSRTCADLDPLVEAFRMRPLVAEHPYVWVDATYHKVRIDGHVTSQATVVALLAEFAKDHEAMLLYDLDVDRLGTLRVAEHFTVDDGRITRIRQIHDTAAVRAAGLGPRP